MTKTLLSGMILTAGIGLLSISQESRAYEILAPGNLGAEVNGMIVDLAWEWGDGATKIMSEDFEGDEFPAASWEVKNTYSYDEYGNWIIYDFSESDPEDSLAHSGFKTALVMMGAGDEDETTESHQDEWLIVRPEKGASYMDFWYYLHPQLLEVGGFKDFPDHYYVNISFDNGRTWEELWDGRWDMGNVDAVQQASLFLGDDADENTLVAFQAVSGEKESLYFLWSIDDVEFYSSEEMAARKPELRQRVERAPLSQTLGIPVSRRFTPGSLMTETRRVGDEWLNGGNTTYRVYLDDEIISDYLKARHITDYSKKTPGTHTYRVMGWSEGMDEEFEAASIDVEIGEVTFMPPTNLVGKYELQDNGKYTISASWEAPESDMQPTYYLIFVNGKRFGWIDAGEELVVSQNGLYKGAYEISVEACYEYSEGASERVTVYVFPGTVPTPVGLGLNEESGVVRLSWGYLDTEEVLPESYSIYRGDELLAEGIKDMEFADNEPLLSKCHYNVHAVYADGTVSLPAVALFEPQNATSAELPLEESFDNGHMPAGWSVDLVDAYNLVKDMYAWRFDNWFNSEINAESGINGGFASVSGVAAGMNRLESYLVTPIFDVPEEGEVVVSFDKYFFEDTPGPSGPASFMLSVSTNNGEWWNDLQNLVELPDGRIECSLAEYAGNSLQLRWGFLGRNSGVAAIDNVKVYVAGTDGVEDVCSSLEVIEVYTIDGVKAGKSLSNLPSGIYVVKMSDGTVKKQMVR